MTPGTVEPAAGSDGADAPVRVASWPHWYRSNPYITLLHDALEPFGIEHIRFASLDPGAYGGPEGLADFVHLHWVYPLWREGRGPLRRRMRRALDRLGRIRDRGVGLIWTVHNIAPHDGLRRGEAEAYRALHDLVDLRIFHTESAREAAADRYGRGAGDTLIQPHGNWDGAALPPGPRPSVLSREGLPAGSRVLLCFGQIRAYKGFDSAVEALRLLGRNYHLVIAGRSNGEGRRLRRLAQGDPRITLILEELDDQRLADLLGVADSVLLPYHAVTGSGAFMHAVTAGRGVVATDLPFFDELLGQEPEAGVLIPDASPEALAGGIREFFRRGPETRGKAARRLAERFGWPEVVIPLAEWLLQAGPKIRRRNPGLDTESADAR